jgi:hypothetical protein
MSEAFEKYFKTIEGAFNGDAEHKEEIKIYMWISWRDSRRNLVKTMEELPRND